MDLSPHIHLHVDYANADLMLSQAVYPPLRMESARFCRFLDGDWRVRLDAGSERVIRAGEAVCFPSDTVRHFQAQHPDRRRAQVVWFRPLLFGSVDLLRILRPPHYLGQDQAERIAASIASLAACRHASDPVTAIRQRRIAYAFLDDVAACCAEQTIDRQLVMGLARLEPVITFCQDHLHEPLTRTDLASVLNCSEARCHQLFIEFLGESPMRFLRQLRLRQAANLLQNSDDSCDRIAQRCGFTCPFHFSRSFKNFHGLSPRSYRQQALAERQP